MYCFVVHWYQKCDEMLLAQEDTRTCILCVCDAVMIRLMKCFQNRFFQVQTTHDHSSFCCDFNYSLMFSINIQYSFITKYITLDSLAITNDRLIYKIRLQKRLAKKDLTTYRDHSRSKRRFRRFKGKPRKTCSDRTSQVLSKQNRRRIKYSFFYPLQCHW